MPAVSRIPVLPRGYEHAGEGFKYKIEEKLGEGGFGSVYKATKITLGVSDKKIFAIKIVRLAIGELEKKAMEEFANESRIVQLLDSFLFDNCTCLVMHHYPLGSLWSLVTREGGLLHWKYGVKIAYQISSALVHLKSKKIIHRDIKPDNILVHSYDVRNNINICLADLGTAANISGSDGATTYTGTPGYRAPEITKLAYNSFFFDENEKYSYEVDVWSLGATLFTTLSGFRMDPVTEDFSWPKYAPRGVRSPKANPNKPYDTVNSSCGIWGAGEGGIEVPTPMLDIVHNCLRIEGTDRVSAEAIQELCREDGTKPDDVWSGWKGSWKSGDSSWKSSGKKSTDGGDVNAAAAAAAPSETPTLQSVQPQSPSEVASVENFSPPSTNPQPDSAPESRETYPYVQGSTENHVIQKCMTDLDDLISRKKEELNDIQRSGLKTTIPLSNNSATPGRRIKESEDGKPEILNMESDTVKTPLGGASEKNCSTSIILQHTEFDCEESPLDFVSVESRSPPTVNSNSQPDNEVVHVNSDNKNDESISASKVNAEESVLNLKPVRLTKPLSLPAKGNGAFNFFLFLALVLLTILSSVLVQNVYGSTR